MPICVMMPELRIIPQAKPTVVYQLMKVPTCEEEEDSTNRPDAIADDGDGGKAEGSKPIRVLRGRDGGGLWGRRREHQLATDGCETMS
jgi:hypothetical protein